MVFLISYLFSVACLIVSAVTVLFNRVFHKTLSAQYGVKKKKGIYEVPGPLGLPVIGSLWTTMFGSYRGVQYHDANEMKLAKYGAVVRENMMFNFPLIHLFAREDIDKILRRASDFPLRPPNEADTIYRRMRPDRYLNEGLVNLNGPEWHRLRAQLTPPLTRRDTTRHYADSMCAIADDFLAQLAQRREPDTGAVRGFKELVYLAGLESVSDMALERRLGFLDEEMSAHTRLILDSIRGYQTSSNQTMYGLPLWKYLPWGGECFTALMAHKDRLYELLGAVVDESLANLENQELFGADNSILARLLADPRNDIKDVKASVVDYITAGVETIGNSVIFAMALVAKHPEVRQKLQEELNAEDDLEATIRDPDRLGNLPYLRACIQESFRLCPTACQIARILEEQTEVSGGFVLPKYSVVLCQQRIASLQEENFTRAREFLPERWLRNDDDWKCARSLVTPFGVGKRACPGKRLAEQEILIMVAKLYRRFDVSIDGDFETEFNFLLAPKDMRFRVTERA